MSNVKKKPANSQPRRSGSSTGANRPSTGNKNATRSQTSRERAANAPQRKQKPNAHGKEKNTFFLLLELIGLIFKRIFQRVGACLALVSLAVAGFFSKLFRKIDLSYFGEYKAVAAVLGVLAIIVVAAGLIWYTTNKNAYEIYYNGESVGVISANVNITPESLMATLTGRITNDTGSRINPLGVISVTPVHAKQVETEDALLAKLIDVLIYEAELMQISLDGEVIGILRNKDDFEMLKNMLYADYRRDGVLIAEGFSEDLEGIGLFGDLDDIVTVDKLYDYLTGTYETTVSYVIKDGDSLWAISAMHDTPLEVICEINGISSDEINNLRVGRELLIPARRPVLSVVLTYEHIYDTELPYDRQTSLNPTLPAGESRIVIVGMNGTARITEHVTEINGYEHSREKIGEEILISPTTEHVDVGPS